MPKYYPINEEAARRAKNANSFSDYVPGSATAAYTGSSRCSAMQKSRRTR